MHLLLMLMFFTDYQMHGQHKYVNGVKTRDQGCWVNAHIHKQGAVYLPFKPGDTTTMGDGHCHLDGSDSDAGLPQTDSVVPAPRIAYEKLIASQQKKTK